MSDLSDEQVKAVLEYRKLQLEHPRGFFRPDPWQVVWVGCQNGHKQSMLMAANKIGKTMAECFITACHLTGDYPDWWDDLPQAYADAVARWPTITDKPFRGPPEYPKDLALTGVKFDYPLLWWVMGVTGENMRDNLQQHLLGDMFHDGKENKFLPGGMIHPSEVSGVVPAVGTPRLAKDVKIKRKDGGASTLSLKSYSQGQHAIMGPSPDGIGIDEEPRDDEIYPQCLIRTLNSCSGEGGYVRLTFTPENGSTKLVQQYTSELGKKQYFLNATWNDASHLSEQKCEDMLDAIPHYQRKMRSLGIPVLGSGMVYQISEESIACEPFPIPAHYKVISAIDVGIDHPTAGAWAAYDADSDTIYIYRTYRKSGESAPVHAAAFKAGSRGVVIPTVYPHDAEGREKGSGDQLIKTYKDAGLPKPIPFSNPDGSVYVEPGILDIYTRMQTGRFKVFSNMSEWFEEFRLYHRKNGQIVKEKDDIMAATRYAAIMVQRAGVHNRKRTAQPANQMSAAF